MSEAFQLALQYVHVYNKTSTPTSSFRARLICIEGPPRLFFHRARGLSAWDEAGVVDEHLIHCTLQLLSGAAVSLGREKSFEVSDKAYRREPGCREDNELVPIINVRGWFRGIVMRPFNQVRLLSIG